MDSDDTVKKENQFVIPSGNKDGVGPSLSSSEGKIQPQSQEGEQRVSSGYPPYSNPQSDPLQIPGSPPSMQETDHFMSNNVISHEGGGKSPDQLIPPEHTPGIPTSPPPRKKRTFLNKKVLIIIVLLMIIGVGGYVGLTLIFSDTSDSLDKNENVSQEVVSEGTAVSFSNNELISAVANLLTSDFSVSSSFETTYDGCFVQSAYEGEKQNENYMGRVQYNYSSETQCSKYLKQSGEIVYAGGLYYQRESDEDSYTETLRDTVIVPSPGEFVSSYIPYPTLLSIETAQLVGQNIKVVALSSTPAFSDIYTFTFDPTGNITEISIDSEVKEENPHQKTGTLYFESTSETITAPEN